MATLQPVQRSGAPSHAVLLGAALAWIAMAVLAFAAFLASGVNGLDWIAAVLVAALAAGGLGWVVGTTGLGWAGFGGAIGGLLLAALLPLGMILALLFPTGSIDAALPILVASWVGYLVYLAAAAPVIAAGVWLGMRSGWRVHLRADIVVVLGLVMLAGWAGLSLLIISLSRAA
jgi:hypothetical protein